MISIYNHLMRLHTLLLALRQMTLQIFLWTTGHLFCWHFHPGMSLPKKSKPMLRFHEIFGPRQTRSDSLIEKLPQACLFLCLLWTVRSCYRHSLERLDEMDDVNETSMTPEWCQYCLCFVVQNIIFFLLKMKDWIYVLLNSSCLPSTVNSCNLKKLLAYKLETKLYDIKLPW